MAEFRLADNYRAAGLETNHEAMQSRQGPFAKLRSIIDQERALDLTRLYFGLSVPRGTDWFRDAFGDSDNAFSMVDNAREVSVLAGSLLQAAVGDDKVYSALAVISASALGARQPSVLPDLVLQMSIELRNRAIQERAFNPIDPAQIQLGVSKQIATEIAALVQAPELGRAIVALKNVSEASDETSRRLAEQVRSVLGPFTMQMNMLHEEVEILWWHIGGWSRVLEKPFSALDLNESAVFAAFDLAALSLSESGPAAAPAILRRTLGNGRSSASGSATIEEVVKSIPLEDLRKLALPDSLRGAQDICPFLTALSKAQELDGEGWQAPYVKATGLKVDIKVPVVDIALQLYNERLLARAIE